MYCVFILIFSMFEVCLLFAPNELVKCAGNSNFFPLLIETKNYSKIFTCRVMITDTNFSFSFFQAFVRDPDGYYIEFCNCEKLEQFLHTKMAEDAKKYNFLAAKSALTIGKKLKTLANDSKETVKQLSRQSSVNEDFPESFENQDEAVDLAKFENLKKRFNHISLF